MPADLVDLEGFEELFHDYTEQFGHTFTVFQVRGDLADYVMREMRRAVDGDREEITDEELGRELPDGALS